MFGMEYTIYIYFVTFNNKKRAMILMSAYNFIKQYRIVPPEAKMILYSTMLTIHTIRTICTERTQNQILCHELILIFF